MRIVLVFLLFSAALITGCGEKSEKPSIYGPAGRRAFVEYRMNYVENGPAHSVEGVLLKTSPDWVVVKADDGEYVIPIYAIQYMRLIPSGK